MTSVLTPTARLRFSGGCSICHLALSVVDLSGLLWDTQEEGRVLDSMERPSSSVPEEVTFELGLKEGLGFR